MYRILASLAFMIMLTGLSEWTSQRKPLTSAIALKTRSPVLSVTAFLPLVGPAYLAHTLRTKDKPEDTLDLLEDEDDIIDAKKALPAFKHKLLNHAWAPKLEVGPLDIKQFKVGKVKWNGLQELQSTPLERERQRRVDERREKHQRKKIEAEKKRFAKEQERDSKRRRADKDRQDRADRRGDGRRKR